MKINSSMQKLRKWLVTSLNMYPTFPPCARVNTLNTVLVKDALLLSQHLTVDNSLEYSSAL